MPLRPDAQVGLTMRFVVTIDNMPLGAWASCSNLNVTFNPKQIKEGGLNDYTINLPDRIEYGEITLTRAMTKQDSARVQAWLKMEGKTKWVNGTIYSYELTPYIGSTAVITLLDQFGDAVASWTLRNVFPKKWQGPSLDAKSGAIAIESLTLVHEGFL